MEGKEAETSEQPQSCDPSTQEKEPQILTSDFYSCYFCACMCSSWESYKLHVETIHKERHPHRLYYLSESFEEIPRTECFRCHHCPGTQEYTVENWLIHLIMDHPENSNEDNQESSKVLVETVHKNGDIFRSVAKPGLIESPGTESFNCYYCPVTQIYSTTSMEQWLLHLMANHPDRSYLLKRQDNDDEPPSDNQESQASKSGHNELSSVNQEIQE